MGYPGTHKPKEWRDRVQTLLGQKAHGKHQMTRAQADPDCDRKGRHIMQWCSNGDHSRADVRFGTVYRKSASGIHAATAWLTLVAMALGGVESPCRSRTVRDLLRWPLPAEQLICEQTAGDISIVGPTCKDRVSCRSGDMAALKARRGDRAVAQLQGLPVFATPGGWCFTAPETETAAHRVQSPEADWASVDVAVQSEVHGAWGHAPRSFGDSPESVELALASSEEVRRPPVYRWVKVTDQAAFAPRDGAGAVVFADKMWLLGGWNPMDKTNFPHTCASDVWSSEDGATWTRHADASWEPRHTAGYVVHDHRIWIVGGDAIQGHYQNDVWNSDDGTAWKLVADDVPWGSRVLHYTVAHAGRIWVIGGQTLPQYGGGDEVFYNDVWSSRDGAEWERVTEHAPWSPRGMVGGSVVHRDRIWLIGGGTYDTPEHPDRQFFGEVWSSADGRQWQCHTAHAPWHPRQYHETAAFDGRLWVLEGWNQSNRNDVWYSDDGATWHELPATPWAPRHAASVFVFRNALWMVSGNHFGRDVWKLEAGREARSKASLR